MKIGIPILHGRVSPVFDVARRLLVVYLENGRETARVEKALDHDGATVRVRHVIEIGLDVLICGAISQPILTMLSVAGVDVIQWKCGDVNEILDAFMAGQLTEDAFPLPGFVKQSRHGRNQGECRLPLGKRER